MTNVRDVHPASLPGAKIAADCDFERLRRSGPGGQHRNKVETAVRLCHRPTGVVAEASERRSQAENRAVALFRVRVNLALEVRSAKNLQDGPSPLWRSRCRGGKIVISGSHEDFPALLAEAIDTITACDHDLGRAAAVLGCTASQLVRLLKKEPRALELHNRHREQSGLGRLK
jgi:hypothetical protein